MRLLITGAAGQVGQAVVRAAQDRYEVLALDSTALDITQADAVQNQLNSWRPDVVINAAAYTAVDKAESEPQRAHAVNAEGPRNLATSCASIKARLIHISTDFVFDGHASTPYAPDAPTKPLSVYGKTKRDGELAVMQALPHDYTIVRTAWVYGPGGKNFVSTMLRLLAEREELGVVMDQIGTPTCTTGLAEMLLRLAESNVGRAQTLHWTDAGVASWYDFACAIRELAIQNWPEKSWGQVKPIYTVDYPTPAHRPRYSVLDCRAVLNYSNSPRHWKVNLDASIGALLAPLAGCTGP